jgi:hypothetical protein
MWKGILGTKGFKKGTEGKKKKKEREKLGNSPPPQTQGQDSCGNAQASTPDY